MTFCVDSETLFREGPKNYAGAPMLLDAMEILFQVGSAHAQL